ncbi:MAG: chromosomal replication initiator protein DnaA [bacterium]|nr:chromosomal replication initiator protein DnaA [bacterium]
MTNEELWQATLAQIQFSISRANFATWLKNTYILSKKDGGLIISVPNNFSKEWLENKYNKIIFKILRELDEGIREVSYTVARAAPDRQKSKLQGRQLEQPSELEAVKYKADKATNLNPKYTFENFIVGPFNELAAAAATAAAKSPGSAYNPLFLYGGVGLGKTHLLQAIGNSITKEFPQMKIRYVPSERFISGFISAIGSKNVEPFRQMYRTADVIIMDDVQFFTKKEKSQEELFHVFNLIYEQGKQIIFSSDRPPKAIPDIEERLRSRFEGGMVADISAPDYETRMAILKAKAQETGLEVADEVADYIVSEVQRNIRELEGALNRLLAFQRLNNSTATLGEARGMLRSIIQAPNRSATPKKIIQAVAEFYDMAEKEIMAISRKKEVVKPRQIAMYLLREELKSSYPFIGKRFNGKDHTTAIYACEKISKEILSSEFLADEITLIKQRIYSG